MRVIAHAVAFGGDALAVVVDAVGAALLLVLLLLLHYHARHQGPSARCSAASSGGTIP